MKKQTKFVNNLKEEFNRIETCKENFEKIKGELELQEKLTHDFYKNRVKDLYFVAKSVTNKLFSNNYSDDYYRFEEYLKKENHIVKTYGRSDSSINKMFLYHILHQSKIKNFKMLNVDTGISTIIFGFEDDKAFNIEGSGLVDLDLEEKLSFSNRDISKLTRSVIYNYKNELKSLEAEKVKQKEFKKIKNNKDFLKYAIGQKEKYDNIIKDFEENNILNTEKYANYWK